MAGSAWIKGKGRRASEIDRSVTCSQVASCGTWRAGLRWSSRTSGRCSTGKHLGHNYIGHNLYNVARANTFFWRQSIPVLGLMDRIVHRIYLNPDIHSHVCRAPTRTEQLNASSNRNRHACATRRAEARSDIEDDVGCLAAVEGVPLQHIRHYAAGQWEGVPY